MCDNREVITPWCKSSHIISGHDQFLSPLLDYMNPRISNKSRRTTLYPMSLQPLTNIFNGIVLFSIALSMNPISTVVLHMTMGTKKKQNKTKQKKKQQVKTGIKLTICNPLFLNLQSLICDVTKQNELGLANTVFKIWARQSW